MEIIFKILGAAGLLFITVGVWVKNEINQDILFIFGGILLLIYSASIGDPIFITLQIVFILSAMYELFKLEFKKPHKKSHK